MKRQLRGMRAGTLPCLLCLMGVTATPGHAGFVLLVDDPSTPEIEVRIEDNRMGDNNQLAGLISYAGAVGGIQLSATAESKGAVGSATMPRLNLFLSESTRLAPGSVGGTVDILLTDTDFQSHPAKGVAAVDVDGFGGFFEFSFFGDGQNREFGEGFEIASTVGSVSPGFDQTWEGPGAPIGSLTIQSRVGFTDITNVAGFRADLVLEGTGPGSWHNTENPVDVNASSTVEPLDALLVINTLNVGGPRRLSAADDGPPPFYDINDDGFVSPIDALLVINVLNTVSQRAVSTGNTYTAPEPSGIGFMLGSLVLALGQRRRQGRLRNRQPRLRNGQPRPREPLWKR